MANNEIKPVPCIVCGIVTRKRNSGGNPVCGHCDPRAGRGGWRNGGRPAGSTSRKPTREIVKQIRWTAAEWADVETLAGGKGMTCSEYIRSCTLKNNS